MELYEVWNHLDSIANYSRSMIEEPGDVWCKYLIACRIAQACVDEIIEGMQKDGEQ